MAGNEASAEGRVARIARLAVSDGIPRRSFYAAIVVGTVLNVINQGDALWAGGKIDILKICLTYCVPYCVATYGAVFAKLRGS